MHLDKLKNKTFIFFSLYDSRYYFDEDAAICYSQYDTLLEAKDAKKEMFDDAVIVKETAIEKIHKGEKVLEIISSEIIE